MSKFKLCFIFILLSFINLFSNDLFLQTDFHETLIPLKERGMDLVFTYTLNIAKKGSSIQVFELTTPSSINVPVIFFNRKSDKLLVFGQGFSCSKEEGVVVAELFYDYDVVLFDYRWKDLVKFFFEPSTLWDPIQKLIYDESEEVVTVVEYCKSFKEYREIIGLGECYGAFNFVITQSQEYKRGNILFTKLVLDSCWYSLSDFCAQVLKDPWLTTNPRDGGAPYFLKRFLNNRVIHFVLSEIFKTISPNVCLRNYLGKLENVPILFIHGINDLLVPFDDTYNLLWNSVKKAPKVALITPYKHVENIKKTKLYKNICDEFVDSKCIKEFVERLRKSFGFKK